MTLTILGSGYVAQVAGACLAEVGHKVVQHKIDHLMQSRMADRVIADGRNLYHPERLRSDGWAY